MEPSQVRKVPEFTDIQLQYITALARQDAAVAAFIEAQDKRALIDPGRTAVVANIGLTALAILDARAKARAEKEAALKAALEAAKANKEKVQEIAPGPRVAPESIPDLPAVPTGNGSPDVGHPGGQGA